MLSSPPPLLSNARREARFVVAVWLTACLYTVGYAGLYGYRADPQPHLTLGMPDWVLWGIFTPWVACSAITCWFALRGIRDDDLGEEHDMEEEAGRAH